jgi:hypothetical protein
VESDANDFLSVCDGCGKEWFNVFCDNGVCMDCVRARAKAAFSGRCSCGRRARPDGVKGAVVLFNGRDIGRKFIPCKRCLGVIKQVA